MYTVLLSRAVPAYTWYEIQWQVPLAQGWAQIHAARIMDGTAMIWPQLNASALGRWFMKIRNRITRNRPQGKSEK